MPKFVNTLDHAIRASDGKGNLPRVQPGQVVEATGEYADALAACPGVETASGDHESHWQSILESRQMAGAMAGDGSRIAAKAAIGPQRLAVRMDTIVAPLQRVVGDDAAPYGPPSGTITTRGVAGTSGSLADREAFLQNDVAGDEGEKVDAPGASELDILAGRATQSDIHNAQVENAALAEESAQRFVGGSPLGNSDPISGDYDNRKKHSALALQAEADRRGLAIAGSGSQGNVTRKDLITALEHDDDAKSE